jgi:hypothetical protein
MGKGEAPQRYWRPCTLLSREPKEPSHRQCLKPGRDLREVTAEGERALLKPRCASTSVRHVTSVAAHCHRQRSQGHKVKKSQSLNKCVLMSTVDRYCSRHWRSRDKTDRPLPLWVA